MTTVPDDREAYLARCRASCVPEQDALEMWQTEVEVEAALIRARIEALVKARGESEYLTAQGGQDRRAPTKG